MREYLEVNKALEDFGNDLVKKARANLARRKINTTKKLSDSLSFKSKASKNSIEFDAYMEEYGEYQDLGVKGSKSSKKAPKSPYKYTDKRPPASVFDKWQVKKGLAARDERGRFKSRRSINFAIATSIFLYGIKTTYFFTDAFNSAYKKFDKTIEEKFGLDVENFLKFALNNPRR